VLIFHLFPELMKRTRGDINFTYANKRRRVSPYYNVAANVARFAPPRRTVPRSALVVPGYTRTGGFYGRTKGRNGNIAETKFFDTSLSFTFDTTMEVPATGQLVLIPQGDTESSRDGRQCTATSIQIRATITLVPAAAANGGGTYYLYLVLDKQCNGAAAAVTDVFTSANSSLALANLENSDRFVILKKWVRPINVTAGVTTAYSNVCHVLEFYKKLNIPLTYSSTTGAITEIRSNNLFLVAGAQNQDDTIQFGGVCRIRFKG